MTLAKHSLAKSVSSSRKSESYEMSDVHCNSKFLLQNPPHHTTTYTLKSKLPILMLFFPIASSEIAELMAVKAKHSAGGEYSPDWRPKVITPNPTDLIIRPSNPDTPNLTVSPGRAHAPTAPGAPRPASAPRRAPHPRRARASSLAHRRQTPRARRAAKGQGCGCGSSSSCHPPTSASASCHRGAAPGSALMGTVET